MLNNKTYQDDLEIILKQNCNWNTLENKTILISGASGLIGSILVDMFCLIEEKYHLGLKLVLLARKQILNNKNYVKSFSHDITQPFEYNDKIDYIISAAANTHPVAYSKFPIETAATNVFGTYNLLKLASKNVGCRFLLLSSVEVYGQSLNETSFSELDCGYINCNTPRACYYESKRLSEALCQSFYSEKNVDFVTARLCRCYGPTLRKDDSKALSQFIYNGLNKQNIILKSKGDQYYSYLYAADAASAIIFLLINGNAGEAYNVSDKESDITLKNLAELIASECNTKVIFELPNEIERNGFSNSQFGILNSEKINSLGWKAEFNIKEGVRRTLSILRSL